MKSGSGEFCIVESYGNKHRSICFYKHSNGFFKDINLKLPNEKDFTWHTIKISKEEYLKKLKYFLWLVKNEVENEANG